MATLNSPQSGKAAKGKSRNASPRVDLTAMVDLMFLLTTFFMLTTSLSELKAADISKPVESDFRAAYPASRTMTILLGKNNKAVYYMGEPGKEKMRILPVDLIEKGITESKALVVKANSHNILKHLIVIIKPTKTSTFKNFVDVIDEMKIAAIQSYAIEDQHISADELSFMKENGI
jgi:biopolymer transport protein ExbD